LANSQQNTTPQILLIATYHFSWHFTFHSFAPFFTGKISKRGLSLTSNPATSSPHSPSPPATPLISQFSPLPQDPKSKRSCSTVQTSNLTQIPYSPGLSKMFICTVPVSTITNIVNFSLTSGQFHPTLNESVISSMLKTPTLNKEKLSNYRLNSNPSIISRIIEPVVKCRRIDHLTSNSLFNSHQSVYCKHQFTEIALLYIHDHLINAIRSQKISCLCLLDLSAAYDTIDHEISTTRLSSWFGIHGSVLSWLESYLSSRCFRVKRETDLFSWYTSLCGVPQGFVLGRLLFVVYTTRFSTLISCCSLNHHLYADDSQLYLSFLLTHFDSSIDHFHNALDQTSSWMTANRFTLNFSKTEFLLIGLSKQLAKINN